jgi:hypothetical protein
MTPYEISVWITFNVKDETRVSDLRKVLDAIGALTPKPAEPTPADALRSAIARATGKGEPHAFSLCFCDHCVTHGNTDRCDACGGYDRDECHALRPE